MPLEGKELEVKLGEFGSASVDLTPDLKLKLQVGVEVDVIGELKKLAAKTSTPLDDAFLATLEKIAAANAALSKG